jgi:phosphate transport system permease protein
MVADPVVHAQMERVAGDSSSSLEPPGRIPPDNETPPRQSLMRGGRFGANFSDSLFYWGTGAFACVVLVLTVAIGIQLWRAALPSIHTFGARFVISSTWDPVQEVFGALPFIFGTIVSSFLALCLAVPISLGTAIFLAELAPPWMRTPISFMVELLAAVPSVVYGLWGIFVLMPGIRVVQQWVQDHFYQRLAGAETHLAATFHAPAIAHAGPSHLIAGDVQGPSMITGAAILAIMVLPFITAVSREVIKAVPPTQREAAFGLGATHWEAIRGPVLRYARSGIIGAVILGLARALGETMAVTMVIGNGNEVAASLFAPASTLASALANQFAEAGGKQLPALMYLGLILFGITICVNIVARLLIWNMARGMHGAVRE